MMKKLVKNFLRKKRDLDFPQKCKKPNATKMLAAVEPEDVAALAPVPVCGSAVPESLVDVDDQVTQRSSYKSCLKQLNICFTDFEARSEWKRYFD